MSIEWILLITDHSSLIRAEVKNRFKKQMSDHKKIEDIEAEIKEEFSLFDSWD